VKREHFPIIVKIIVALDFTIAWAVLESIFDLALYMLFGDALPTLCLDMFFTVGTNPYANIFEAVIRRFLWYLPYFCALVKVLPGRMRKVENNNVHKT
jgi:beta-lactamase regulating signal transducer with metallopeptidase domain